MEIICASICYRRYAHDEVSATLENAPGIGFKEMEIHGPMTWSVAAVNSFDLPTVKAQIAASGLRCSGIYPPGWGGQDKQDVYARAQAIHACARYAAELGGDHISTTGAENRTAPGALDRVLACVGQVLELVPIDSPVKLTLEPHLGNILEQPEDFDYVLNTYSDPRLGLCIDTGHLHAAGVDPVAMIHRFASRIYAVHIKDHVGAVSVGIGRGEIDLMAIVTALKEIGYPGGLTLELEVEDPQNLPFYTKEAYVYLCGMLGKKL
jgi:sugar phosphate isomerase/epimerase